MNANRPNVQKLHNVLPGTANVDSTLPRRSIRMHSASCKLLSSVPRPRARRTDDGRERGNAHSEELALPLLGDTSEEVSTLLEIIRRLGQNRRLSKGQFGTKSRFI